MSDDQYPRMPPPPWITGPTRRDRLAAALAMIARVWRPETRR